MENKLEVLTAEQKEKMLEVRQYWLDYIFSCKNSLNKEQAKESIEWLYEFCKLEKPVIIYVDSPMSCQIAAVYLKEFLKELKNANVRANVGDNVRANVWANVRANVGDNVWANVRDNVRDNVGANVEANVRANVEANVSDNVRDNVGANVRANVEANVSDNVRANVGANVWANVSDNVGANVRDNVWTNVRDNVWTNAWVNVWDNFENFCSYGSVSDYGWVSFFDFFTQIGVLDNANDFNEFKRILLSGIYDTIQLNEYCIVSDMPNDIKRNPTGLLHSLDSSAISFRDGYHQHYVNGRFLPAKYFASLSNKTFSIEDFTKEENEEYKSTCIAFMQEKYGDECVVNFFRQHLKEVDTYIDKKDKLYLEGTTKGMNIGVYTLFKGQINNEDIAYVRCYCPSTDRMFFLGVDSNSQTSKDAIASLYRIPSKLKSHIKYISRQGERFSTTLTENGHKILNGLTDTEISDVVGLTGNDYFRLMKYEF